MAKERKGAMSQCSLFRLPPVVGVRRREESSFALTEGREARVVAGHRPGKNDQEEMPFITSPLFYEGEGRKKILLHSTKRRGGNLKRRRGELLIFISKNNGEGKDPGSGRAFLFVQGGKNISRGEKGEGN